MVFISAHYKDEKDFASIAKELQLSMEEIIFCGSAMFSPQVDATMPYHPLLQVENFSTTVQQQHAYLDCLMRAIQIETPAKLIYFSATAFDTSTVLARTKEHCKIVNVEVVEMF